jgi:hypothetical protein
MEPRITSYRSSENDRRPILLIGVLDRDLSVVQVRAIQATHFLTVAVVEPFHRRGNKNMFFTNLCTSLSKKKKKSICTTHVHGLGIRGASTDRRRQYWAQLVISTWSMCRDPSSALYRSVDPELGSKCVFQARPTARGRSSTEPAHVATAEMDRSLYTHHQHINSMSVSSNAFYFHRRHLHLLCADHAQFFSGMRISIFFSE